MAYDYINSTNSALFKNTQRQVHQPMQPIHEYCIDPFTIIWFKRLHKFYAESYLDKFQLARNLFSGSTQNGTQNPSNNINNIANSQNQRVRSLLAVLNDPNYLTTRQNKSKLLPAVKIMKIFLLPVIH